ncbi:MAG: ZIP family metal transporter, partial [Caldiserica bacterium]|nr:ZIP family metal transporter [Caldisericota bacterium]
MEALIARISGGNLILQGLIGGIVITLFNTLGALLVVVWRRPREGFLDGALGFAAGVMLTASFT